MRAALCLMLTACEATTVGAPDDLPDDVPADARVVAETPAASYAATGPWLDGRPAIRLNAAAGAALPGRRVEFRVVRPDSTARTFAVRTDGEGRGVMPLIDVDTVGAWRVEARAGMAPPLPFDVVALPRPLMTGPVGTRCPLGPDQLPRFEGLPRSTALLRAGRPLRVVALGTSSTSGYGLDDWSKAYPYIFRDQLRGVFPRSDILLWNRGSAGFAAERIDARLELDAFSVAPDLVFLQTGMMDAIWGVSLELLRTVTERTIDRLQARGIDVVLIDQQRMPGVGESVEYLRYVDLIAQIAEARNLPLVRRYDWMRAMLERGVYSYPDLLVSDQRHHTVLGHECVAHLLTVGLTTATVRAAR